MIRDVGGGEFELDGVRQVAFPGWTAGLGVSETPSLGIVWPLEGGGPRRLVVKRFTNPVQRLEDSFVRGVPITSRAGLAFETFREEPLSFGAGVPVVLEFVPGTLAGGWAGDVTNGVADRLNPLGIRITTAYPDDLPYRYGHVRVGAAMDRVAPGYAGVAFSTDLGLPLSGANSDPMRTHLAMVRAFIDPAMQAATISHEILHLLGEQHDTVPGSIMSATGAGPGSRASPGTAARVRARTAGYQ